MPRTPPDDDRAFEEAMRGARPLTEGARRVSGAPPPSSRRVPARPRGAKAAFEVEEMGEAVSGRASDVSAAVLRALRRGDPRPEAEIDLHGRTRDEGLRAAERFLIRARAEGRRAVLVIHGRGQNSNDGTAVLRPALAAWLASAAAARVGVMAFAPAPVRSGGAGATVVLLRRHNR